MSMLCIPSYKTDDPNYRYKMPRLVAKVEGRGNGIRTNIVNMGDIARSLKRPPDYPTKFCGHELGTSSKFDASEGKAIVNGAHEQQDLQTLIDKFIEKFVLCENCNLPEIDLLLKKGKVLYQCNACGQKGDTDNSHKLATYILKNPPDGADSTMGVKKKKGRKEERKVKGKDAVDVEGSEDEDKKKKKKKFSEDEDDKKSKKKSSKTSKEGEVRKSSKTVKESDSDEDEVDENKVEKKKNKKSSKKPKKDAVVVDNVEELSYDSPEIADVISQLIDFVTETNPEASEISPNVTAEMFADELRLLQRSQDFNSILKVFVALEVLFAERLQGMRASSIDKRAKYLLLVAASVTDKDVLVALQDFINLRAGSPVAPEGFKAYSGLLQKFYNLDILSGDGILSFFTKEKSQKKKSGPTEAFLKAKEASASMVEWLACSEGSDDESEEQSEVPIAHVVTKSIGTIEHTNGLPVAIKQVDYLGDSDIDIDDLFAVKGTKQARAALLEGASASSDSPSSSAQDTKNHIYNIYATGNDLDPSELEKPDWLQALLEKKPTYGQLQMKFIYGKNIETATLEEYKRFQKMHRKIRIKLNNVRLASVLRKPESQYKNM